MAKKTMSAALKKKLHSLRKQGKKAAKAENVKPYYFSGKKKAKKRKRKASPAQLRALAKGRSAMKAKRSGHKTRRENLGMATRKRKHKNASRKSKGSQIVVMNSTRRKKRRNVRMHGSATGRGSIVKNFTHNGINTVVGVGGAIAAGFAANKLPVADPKIKAGIVTALGIVLTTMVKNEMVKSLGLGMSIMGGTALVRAFAPNLPLMGEEQIQLTDSQVKAIERQLEGDDDMEGIDDDDMMGAVTDFHGDGALGAVTDFHGESALGYVVANQ